MAKRRFSSHAVKSFKLRTLKPLRLLSHYPHHNQRFAKDLLHSLNVWSAGIHGSTELQAAIGVITENTTTFSSVVLT